MNRHYRWIMQKMYNASGNKVMMENIIYLFLHTKIVRLRLKLPPSSYHPLNLWATKHVIYILPSENKSKNQ